MGYSQIQGRGYKLPHIRNCIRSFMNYFGDTGQFEHIHLTGAIGGYDNNLGAASAGLRPQTAQHSEAIHMGHHQVEQNEPRCAAIMDNLKSLQPVASIP